MKANTEKQFTPSDLKPALWLITYLLHQNSALPKIKLQKLRDRAAGAEAGAWYLRGRYEGEMAGADNNETLKWAIANSFHAYIAEALVNLVQIVSELDAGSKPRRGRGRPRSSGIITTELDYLMLVEHIKTGASVEKVVAKFQALGKLPHRQSGSHEKRLRRKLEAIMKLPPPSNVIPFKKQSEPGH